MGQKINPTGFRLGVNRTADSRWYADSADFGRLLHDAWEVKKAFSPHIAPPIVDEVYALARKHGAWGGKITGAGGGGFMVFACPFDRRLDLERTLADAGVQVRPFSFVTHGVQSWCVEEPNTTRE